MAPTNPKDSLSTTSPHSTGGRMSSTRRLADTGPFELRFSIAPPSIAGQPSAYVLRVLDVGNGIEMEKVFQALAADGASRGPSALRSHFGAGAGGVVLAARPIDLEIGVIRVETYRTAVRVRLFDFGVAAIRFRLDLPDLSPAALIKLSATLARDATFDGAAKAVWERVARQLGSAVLDPSQVEFVEDYTVFVLPTLPGHGGGTGKSGGDVIARMLLGEDDPRTLAPEQTEEMWRRSIRYFEDDEVFIDYDAAVVVEPSCSTEVVDILELATVHQLELRYYDTLVNRASERIASDVAARGTASSLWRSPFSGVAERAVYLALEVGELTDRFERSVTLIGDTHSVQVYNRAAERFRIAEAKDAVHEKIENVARTAEVLTAALHARRGLFLEMLVIGLISIEILLAFFRH